MGDLPLPNSLVGAAALSSIHKVDAAAVYLPKHPFTGPETLRMVPGRKNATKLKMKQLGILHQYRMFT